MIALAILAGLLLGAIAIGIRMAVYGQHVDMFMIGLGTDDEAAS